MTPRPHTPLDPRVLAAAVQRIRAAATSVLTATDLAEEVGYSPFHFNRAFRASTGITPGQFLTAVRIDAAKRLLLSGTDAVIDVASEVGFDSLSSFTRRFRVVVGVTPAALRILADDIADASLRPFSLGDPSRPGSGSASTCPTSCAPPPRSRCGSAGFRVRCRWDCRWPAWWSPGSTISSCP